VYRGFGLAALLVVGLVGPTQAAVLRVEQNGTGDFVLIQDAVNAAADGDTILIGPGRYEDIQARGPTLIRCVAFWDDPRNLTFVGVHRDSVIIGRTTYTPSGTQYSLHSWLQPAISRAIRSRVLFVAEWRAWCNDQVLYNRHVADWR